MLVIGHRGAAGLAKENSIEALHAGKKAGADMLEFDVRLTKDKVPILVHDFHTLRTHHSAALIHQLTLEELQERSKGQPFVTLKQALDGFFGKIILNIELKGSGIGDAVVDLLERDYIKKAKQWDNILLSSFNPKELLHVRERAPNAKLALLHSDNPFLFIAYEKRLDLTAVGFHRHYMGRLALEIARRLGIFTYVYTVNHTHTALLLAQKQIDGIVTDRPDTILAALNKNRDQAS